MSSAINAIGSTYAPMTYGLQTGASAAPADPAKLTANNLLSNLDGDGNGSLSQTELQKAVDEMSSATADSEAGADELFAALDTDEDGAVTESEITTTLQTLAERQGVGPARGGPGGPDEPNGPLPPPPASEETDSTTSFSAVSAADANADGAVSVEELAAYQQSQSEDDASASTRSDTAASTPDRTSSSDRLTIEVQSMIQRLAQTYGDPAQTNQPNTADLSISA